MSTALLEPTVDELTRRRLLGGAGALGVWTVLAGCASHQAAAPAAPAGGAAFPSRSSTSSAAPRFPPSRSEW